MVSQLHRIAANNSRSRSTSSSSEQQNEAEEEEEKKRLMLKGLMHTIHLNLCWLEQKYRTIFNFVSSLYLLPRRAVFFRVGFCRFLIVASQVVRLKMDEKFVCSFIRTFSTECANV